jgi:hypothetical protein
MRAFSIERNIAIPFLAVNLLFVVSRIAYDRAGVQFQEGLYQGWWHYIDPQLLSTDLWRSIFHLHSQPPLMNLFSGIVLQGFPDTYRDVFHLIYFLMGLVFTSGLYVLGLQMEIRPWVAAGLAAWFMISPATVMYEHLLAYGYPIALLLVWAAICLVQFIKTKHIAWGFAFFLLPGMIALLWGLFHIVWLLMIAAALFLSGLPRKKLVLAAILPILVVSGWYSKNLVQVGDFTASTWMGMNLSKISTFRTSKEQREDLVKDGALSEFALLPPFRHPEVYLELLPETRSTGIPLLDLAETSLGTRNFHHLVYAEASSYYLHDAIYIITHDPASYLRSIWQAFYIYFHSASDFEPVVENREHIRALDTAWNRLFYAQWQSDESSIDRNVSRSPAHVGWWIATALVAVVIMAIRFIRKRHLEDRHVLVVSFMLFNILFVTVAGNLLDIGENNRFRFVIDPLIVMLLAFLLQNSFQQIRGRSVGK